MTCSKNNNSCAFANCCAAIGLVTVSFAVIFAAAFVLEPLSRAVARGPSGAVDEMSRAFDDMYRLAMMPPLGAPADARHWFVVQSNATAAAKPNAAANFSPGGGAAAAANGTRFETLVFTGRIKNGATLGGNGTRGACPDGWVEYRLRDFAELSSESGLRIEDDAGCLRYGANGDSVSMRGTLDIAAADGAKMRVVYRVYDNPLVHIRTVVLYIDAYDADNKRYTGTLTLDDGAVAFEIHEHKGASRIPDSDGVEF